ncbi:ABC transporter transmembrane domain-containing protein [Nitrosomonas sp.]|uniref:ABC transporter transmembrane domain-containing protein n=1 Tax=Nitrosomonas sp. TaxID=42353 RepID=UPI00272F0725|nr:ABC transporter transmembrane domain-containing protein [Nitrosomonas sp.]MDP1786145.1 ABC transporter transmembrane domain-containing protein [Nitrosomonas sp.]MDP2224794.1 ABC transporter transmembrane domain-containing protein [Nitrosomonas sp.]
MLALFAMTTMAAALASLPILIKQILESTFIDEDPSLMQTAVLAMIALFIIRGIASYLSIFTVNKATGKLGIDLRLDFFNKLLTLPVSQYSHLNKNNEINTLISNIHQITQTTPRYITIITQDSLAIIGLIICTLYLNQEFSLLLLLVTSFVVLVTQMTHSHLNRPDQESLLASKNLIQHLSQSIAHHRKIRIDGGQMYESQRLGKISETIYHAEMQQAIVKAIAVPAGQIITALILTAVIYMVALQVITGALNLHEVGALISVVLLLILPIQRIAGLPKQLAHDQKIIETIFSFLDQASEHDTGIISIPHVSGKFVFEQVRFCSDAHATPILNHINFTIKPGEVTVFTGYTAEEKNALINLILHLQQPASGRILLDDHPLADIQLNNLHANIAMLTEDDYLLDEKIAGNIAYGTMRCANEAKITTAAHASHAMEFIRHMPEGLQTQIGKTDTTINKQQFRQLAIARALVKNAPILILDEIPTHEESNPGNLLSALEKLMQNRTTLIFNQHIPQLKKIDRIVVLENGCITESLKEPNNFQAKKEKQAISN